MTCHDPVAIVGLPDCIKKIIKITVSDYASLIHTFCSKLTEQCIKSINSNSTFWLDRVGLGYGTTHSVVHIFRYNHLDTPGFWQNCQDTMHIFYPKTEIHIISIWMTFCQMWKWNIHVDLIGKCCNLSTQQEMTYFPGGNPNQSISSFLSDKHSTF